MSKRKIINTIKRKIFRSFNQVNRVEDLQALPDGRQGVMRQELEKMAKLNSQLILMMK